MFLIELTLAMIPVAIKATVAAAVGAGLALLGVGSDACVIVGSGVFIVLVAA